MFVPLALVVYWAVATAASRPTLAGETEVLFEASRIRAGWPLYVDPLAGAHEYGSLPARYLVTYPPLWSWLVAHVPAGTPALLFGRAASGAAWLGALALFVARARPACRAQALAAAAFYAGTFNIALFAASGRPDSIAVLLATVGLARSIRAGRVDAASGALFALAAWVKPTVFGLAAGALVAGALSLRSDARERVGARWWVEGLAGFAGAAAVSAALALALGRASHGAWIAHLVRSNLQPLSLVAWGEAMRHDAFFFAGPAAYALAIGWRDRRRPGARIALSSLAFAFAWAVFARAKIGSSTNYWMESSVGVVALVSVARPPAAASRPLLAALGLAQAAWVGVASAQSATYRVAADRRIASLLDGARATCGACPGDFVMSDDPAAELRLDGRIYTTGYQMAFLAVAGQYPGALWASELQLPEVGCYVEHTGIARIVPEVARVLDARFTRVAETDDWKVLRASGARSSCEVPRPEAPGSPAAPSGP